jgi:hypothetical protein
MKVLYLVGNIKQVATYDLKQSTNKSSIGMSTGTAARHKLDNNANDSSVLLVFRIIIGCISGYTVSVAFLESFFIGIVIS